MHHGARAGPLERGNGRRRVRGLRLAGEDEILPGAKNVEKYVCSQINFQNKLREILGH
jgi:hypothetical protein